jgi:hypothetical protein
MKTQFAYQCDQNGLYLGMVPRQQSPLEPTVYWIPAGATLIAPPDTIPAGQFARFLFDQNVWALEAIPS